MGRGGNKGIKVERVCEKCKKHFWVWPSRIKRGRSKYCSRKCQNEIFAKKCHGETHPRWKGGVKTQTDGYVAVYCPNHPYKQSENRVREHHLVMEKHLGRYLKQKEVVHHINGIRNDNGISNLMLFNSRSEHQVFHMGGK